jgi:hypothetical protein
MANKVQADKLAIKSCHDKLAGIYGKDAVASSGPSEGKPLADAVCHELETRWDAVQRLAGDQKKVEKLALMMAQSFLEKDPSGNECVADLESLGWEKTAAAGIADWLKADAMPNRMNETFAQMMNQVGMPGMNTGGEVETAMPAGNGMNMAGGMPNMQMAADGPSVDDSGLHAGGDDMVDLPLGDLQLPGGDASMGSPMGADDGMADMGNMGAGGMGDMGMGGMGDMGGMGGMGGDVVSIELPTDVVDELLTALEGHPHAGGQDSDAGGMGDMEMVGDDLDMGDQGGDDDSVVEISDDGDSDDVVPGEPKGEQGDDGQKVTNDGDDKDSKNDDGGNPFGGGSDEDDKKEAAMAMRAGHLRRIGQTVLKLGPEMSINNTEQQAGGKDLGTAKSKDVEKPKALEDGNVKPEGHTAGGNKFQDGKTMGAEEKFDPKTLKESEYTNMSSSLMGKEKDPAFANPSIPAGGGKIGNEADLSVNLSTKGTVIATITPQGIIVVGPDGKKFHAPRDLSAKVADKGYQQRLASLLGKINELDGHKFAKLAHKAMKLAETSGNVDGVTMTDTSKKEGKDFTNDAEKKPAEGGAMVGDGGAKQDKEHPTTDTSKKEAEHFQNDAEKKPEEGGVMATKASASKAVKTAGDDDKSDDKNVVKDMGKEIGSKKPMDEQVEVEGHTAGGNKFQDGKTMGAEEKFDAKEVKDSDVSNMSGSLMGKEKDPGFKTPKVPVGTTHPEEHYKPEGDVKIKGTVIAEDQSTKREVAEAVARVENESKVRESRMLAASVYVADLVASREISPDQIKDEIEKYSKLPVQAIQALALSTRKARERIASKVQADSKEDGKVAGLMQPLVLNSGNSKDDLVKKISGLFTLARGVERLQDDKK